MSAADLIEQGREESRATLRAAIARVLDLRVVKMSDAGHALLSACNDMELLARWLERAVTATDEAEVFATQDRS